MQKRHSTLAMKGAKAVDALLRRRIHELDTLQNIDCSLNRVLDLETVLDTTLELVYQRIAADEAAIFLYHPETRELETAAARGPHALVRRAGAVPEQVGTGIVRHVVERRQAVQVGNVYHDEPWCRLYQQISEKTLSELDVPLLDGDEVVGVISLESERERNFGPEDQAFLQILAARAVLALKRAQAYERETRFAEEMRSIGQSAFTIIHRLGSDLGLVRSLINDIEEELEREHVTNPKVDRALGIIACTVHTILELNSRLKSQLGRTEDVVEEPVVIAPGILFEDALASIALPVGIECHLEIERGVDNVCVTQCLAVDILRNLIENACEAMPRGGSLTLRAHNIDGSVGLEVIDTGVGIPEHSLMKIFEPFYSTKGSSGFGLWSARRNARKTRGTLKVESTSGKGTAFAYVLPKALREAEKMTYQTQNGGIE